MQSHPPDLLCFRSVLIYSLTPNSSAISRYLKPSPGNVWLYPVAIDHKLWNGAFAGALDYFLGGSGRLFDIDFVIGNVVLGEPAFGDMAIAAPGGCIDG